MIKAEPCGQRRAMACRLRDTPSGGFAPTSRKNRAVTLRFFDRSASRIPKELGLIGVSHFRVAQSAVKFHSKSLFSDAVEGWNIVITEEPHQAEQQKPVLFPLSQKHSKDWGHFSKFFVFL